MPIARARNGSASHNPAQDATRNSPTTLKIRARARPGALPRDRILGPLQGLRQLKPRDSIRLARGL